MPREAQRFEAVTWSDLLAALHQIAAEESMRPAGLQFTEVTDLVQSQLFFERPVLALQMARVIEIRFASPSAVAYLRTGIPVGRDSAMPEAGAFLLSLRHVDPETGGLVYFRLPRVKRMPTWRSNLRRRLLDLLHDLQGEHSELHQRPKARGLADLLRPETDDLEADLTRLPQRWPSDPVAIPKGSDSEPEAWVHPAGLTAASMQWADLQPAGISLPVWMSGLASLTLVLALILAR